MLMPSVSPIFLRPINSALIAIRRVTKGSALSTSFSCPGLSRSLSFNSAKAGAMRSRLLKFVEEIGCAGRRVADNEKGGAE